MTLNRRGFLHGILATAMAPAIVRSESLMKIVVPSQELILPSAYDKLVEIETTIAEWHARDIEKAIFFGLNYSALGYSPEFRKTFLTK